jgi:hypothetical protein
MLRCFCMHMFLDWDMECMNIVIATMHMMFINGFLLRYVYMHVFHFWSMECMYTFVARLYVISKYHMT